MIGIYSKGIEQAAGMVCVGLSPVCAGVEAIALLGANRLQKNPQASDIKYSLCLLKYSLIALAIIAALGATFFSSLGAGLLLGSLAATSRASDILALTGLIGTAALSIFAHYKAFNYALKN